MTILTQSLKAGLVCMMGALLLPSSAWAESPPNPTPGIESCAASHPFSPKGEDARLVRGFNLPNWEPDYAGLKPDDALLRLMQQEGFTHIRLPIHAEKTMAHFTSDKQRKVYLDALEAEVRRLSQLDFAITLDLHPGSGFHSLHASNPDKGYDILSNAWRHLAGRIKSWPNQDIYLELLNEPALDPVIWWQQAQKLVAQLNIEAPGRKIIVGPAVFQRYEPLLASPPLKGDGIIYALHYYDPFLFTHQGMTWDPSSPLKDMGNLPFPGKLSDMSVQKQIARLRAEGKQDAAQAIVNAYEQPWTGEQIKATMQKIAAWSQRHKAPVMINEFGVLTFAVDANARADWLRFVRVWAEENCLGWTHWEFSDGFGMVDPASTLPDPYVLDALLSR